MYEMTLADSPKNALLSPAHTAKDEPLTMRSRHVLLSLLVFAISVAVLFVAPALALRLMAGSVELDPLSIFDGYASEVHASAVVTNVVLQQGVYPMVNGIPTGVPYVGTKDTYINRWIPTNNFGAEPRLILGQSRAYRPLIYFDLSTLAIPSHATVVSAELGVYCYARNIFASMEGQVYKVYTHWEPMEATWMKRTAASFWAMEGCDLPEVDRATDPVYTRTLFTRDDFHYFDVTSIVQDWIATPSGNEGFLLVAPGPNVIYDYRSADWSTPQERPKLVIDYTIAPLPTPTPTRTNTPGPTPTRTATPTPTTTPAPGVVLDETSLCYTQTVGVWNSATGSGYGSNFNYENVTSVVTASWQPCSANPIPADSMYDVRAFWSVHSLRPTSVPYEIHYDGGTVTVNVNQTKNALGQTVADFSDSGWYSLGIYPFRAGTFTTTGEYVELSAPPDSTVTCADAVRWIQLSGVAGPPYTMTMSASPSTLPSDGAATSTIMVTVTDKFGAPVTDGTMVGLTTTLGTVPHAYTEAEDASVTRLGAWNEYAAAGPSGGRLIYSDNFGDEVTWNFQGPAVSLVYAKNIGGGVADVSVDGVHVTSINFASGALEWQVETQLTTTLGSGVHTIRIRNGGVGRIWLDAFRSGTTTSAGVATAPLTAPSTIGTAIVGATAIGKGLTGIAPTWPFTWTTVSFPGPSVVWVDDDYCSACGNDGHIWNYDAFDVIQDGVDKVLSGGTVHVLAGTYPESVTVNKPVSLLGVGSDVVVVDGTDAAGSRGFYVDRADDVTISGFKIRDFERGIYLRGTGTAAGPRVYNATITNNAFESNNAGANSHAIYGTYVYFSTLCSNDITSGYQGISLENIYQSTICYNEIYNNLGAAITLLTGNDNSLDNNVIYNNQNVGIELVGVTNGNGVYGNTIHDQGWDGILVRGATTATVEIAANVVERTNQAWLNAAAAVPDADHNLGGIVLLDCTDSAIYLNRISNVSNAGGNRPDAAGISLRGNTPTITIEANLIRDTAGHGIHMPVGSGLAVIHGNSIYGNSRYGLNNVTAGTVHAEENWWGCDTLTFGLGEPADVRAAATCFWSPQISLTLSVGATPLVADGVATTTITAIASALNYDIIDGSLITFTSDMGTLVFPSTAAFGGGVASAVLRSGMSAGVVTITGTVEPGRCSESITHTLESGPPTSLSLVADPTTVPNSCDNPRNRAVLTATLRDVNANPVPGRLISFTWDALGSVFPGTGLTDGTGVFTTTFTSSALTGSAQISAKFGTTLTASTSVEVTAGPPDAATITAVPGCPDILPANGAATSAVTVTLEDCLGNPVPDGTMVGFTSTLGTIEKYEYVEAENTLVVTSTGWTVAADPSASDGARLQTSTPGAAAFWLFRGEAVSLIYLRYATGGVMTVRVDGGAPVVIDAAGGTAWLEQVIATGLNPWAVHQIEVVCQSGNLWLDAFRSGTTTSGGQALATLVAPALSITSPTEVHTGTVYATSRLGHPVSPELQVTDDVCFGQGDIIWVNDDWLGHAIGTVETLPAYVGGGTAVLGSDAFPTIPEGVQAVRPDGTVRVLQGNYLYTVAGAPIVITKTLNLIGDGRDSTFIIGIDTSNGIRVQPAADDVLISGFTVRDFDYGMYLDGDAANSLEGVHFTNNAITGTVSGAVTATYVSNGYFADNLFYENQGLGFDLDIGDNNQILNNEIYAITNGFGLRVRSSTGSSSNNVVAYNYVHDVDWDGIRVGVNEDYPQVLSNTVRSTNRIAGGGLNDGGIVLNTARYYVVEYNDVSGVGTAGGSVNTAGIFVDGSSRDGTIRYNRILNNANDGVYLASFFSPPLVNCNHIYGNGRHGLRNAFGTPVNAFGNWWGHNQPLTFNPPGPLPVDIGNAAAVLWNPPVELVLTPSQSTVNAGGASLIITATAEGYGCNIFDNTPITFTTDLGRLGSPPAMVAYGTMSGGAETVSFLPGTVAGTATITATIPNNGVATTTITILPLAPASIVVTGNPTVIPVGTGTAAISATVRDIYGNFVSDSTVITFTSTLGLPNPLTNGTVTGVATTTLNAGAIPGVAQVRASWGGIFGTTNIQIVAGPPYTITFMAAYPDSILADGVSTALIVADVVDQFGNPVPDGTMVHFSTTAGSMIYGWAEAEGASVGKVGGWATVPNAEASGGFFIQSTNTGDNASWSFRGQAVSVRYAQNPGNGRIEVRVDGGVVRVIDSNGPSMWVEDAVPTNLSAAVAHTVTLLAMDSTPIQIDRFRSGASTSAGRAVGTLTSRLLPPTTAVVTATAIGGTFPMSSTSVAFLEPNEVWVDDDYCSTCINDGHLWGFDAFSNMPDGVTAVRRGGVVHVLGGLYTMTVTIPKPLWLDGAGSAATVMRSLTPDVGNAIRVRQTADGVMIDGFAIEDFAYGLWLDGRVSDPLNEVMFSNNVITGCGTGAITATYVNNGSFMDNALSHNNGFGFDLNTGDENLIQGNHIYDTLGFGLRVFSTAGTATGNSIVGNQIHDISWDGIRVGSGSINTQVLSNTVDTTNLTNSPSGFNSGGITLNSTVNTVVEYNAVSGVGTAGGGADTAGVRFDGTNAGGRIRYNRVVDNANYGVLLMGFSSAPVVNCNHIYGNGSFGLRNMSAVVTIDAEGNWWGHQPPPTRGATPPRDIYQSGGSNVDWDPSIELTLVPDQSVVRAGSAPIAVTATGCAGGCCLRNTTPITFETNLGGVGSPPGSVAYGHFSNGQASTSFTPGGVLGTATITATVANAGVVTTTIQIIPGLPYTMTFLANPEEIWVWNCRPAGFPRKSTIAVTVTDQYGNPNAGEAITWTLGSGFGDARLEWTTGVLDVNGFHLTILDSGDVAGLIPVTVTVASVSKATTVRIMAGSPANVLVTRSPAVIPANGTSTSTITATVYDACRNLAEDGTMVGFVTDHGTVPYEYVEAESTDVITSTGDWAVVANSSASGGSYLRTATTGAMLQWEFTGSAVSLIYLRTPTGGQAEVYVDGVIRKTLDMSAASNEWQRETVIVTGLDPVALHYIDVKCVTGVVYLDALRSGTQTTNGVARAILTSEQLCTTATITATAIDRRLESILGPPYDTDMVEFACADLTISKRASPAELLPDSLVTFTLSYGNRGWAEGTATRITDTLPAPLVYVGSSSSPNLGAPQNPESNVYVWQAGNLPVQGGGVITITARRPCVAFPGIITNTVEIRSLMADVNPEDNAAAATVNLIPDRPAAVAVVPNPSSILVDTSATLQITVTDRCGNPVPATTVYLTTSLGAFDADGTITRTTRTTNALGRITMTFWSRPPIRGTATISATAGSVTGVGYVAIGIGPAKQCVAFADPLVLPADGVSTSDVTARLLDTGGNPVVGDYMIGFTTSFGSMLYGFVEDSGASQSPPGSWTTLSHAAASGGTYLRTNVDGTSVYWNFSGNGVSVMYRLAAGAGIGDVYVDGTYVGSLDMDGSATWQAEKAFTWVGSPTAAHVLRLTHRVGTGPIFMDAFRSGVATSGGVSSAVLTAATTPGIATVAATAVSQTHTAVPVLLSSFVDVRFDPADMVITKTVEPATAVAVGQRITFTIEYRNLGPITATNAYLDDVITDGSLDSGWLRNTFFSVAPVTVTENLHYRWELGSLASGQGGTIQFGGVVAENRYWPPGTVITNTATVGSRTYDQSIGNNIRAATTRVLPTPPVTLALSAVPNTIPVGGSISLLRATGLDAYGNPLADGTPVNFSTSLGGFPILQTLTQDAVGGAATVDLVSGPLVGTAWVTATTGSLVATAQVTFTPMGPYTITVMASPDQITVGGATSLIEAWLVDQYGNTVVDGTAVAFGLSPAAAGSVDPLSASTVAGRASTVLRSGTTPVTTTVTATSGAATGSTLVRIVPGAPRVVITANPTTLPVGQRSAVTVIARDEFANPVLDGTVVSFTATLGQFTDSTISTTFGSTVGGASQVFLTSTQVGTAIVRGAVGEDSATVAVTFGPGEPHSIDMLSVEPALIPSCVGTGLARALVKDRYGNVVRDGTVVVFDVFPTGQAEPIDGGRTTNGIAQAIISAGTTPTFATVLAYPSGLRSTVSDEFGITFIVGPPDQLVLVSEPPQVLVGGSRATIRLQVLDCGGNGVSDGTPVTFQITSGGGSLSPQSTTTADGRAYATLTSPDATGSATIRAAAGERERDVVVQYIAGPPFDIILTADPWSIPANGVSTSNISAEVRDFYGNPVADRTTLIFSTDAGRFPAGMTETTSTSGGRASVVLRSSTTSGIARVAAAAGGRRKEIFVDFYFEPTPTPPPIPVQKIYLPVITRSTFR